MTQTIIDKLERADGPRAGYLGCCGRSVYRGHWEGCSVNNEMQTALAKDRIAALRARSKGGE